MAWFRARRDKPEEQREGADRMLRWSALRRSGDPLDGADPDEVERRIRRLSHGTYRD